MGLLPISWDAHSPSVRDIWVVNIDLQIDMNGISMGFLWDFYGISSTISRKMYELLILVAVGSMDADPSSWSWG